MMINNTGPGLFNRSRNRDKANRPMMRPGLAPVDWLLEGIAMAGLLIFIGFVVYTYPKLPAMIPSHFDGAGKVDDYSARGSFWALPAIAFFIYCMMSLVAFIPHQLNFTVKITPENALKQYTFAIRLIRYMKSVIILMFFDIAYSTANVALKGGSGLGLWFMPIVLAGIFIPIIIYLVVASKHR